MIRSRFKILTFTCLLLLAGISACASRTVTSDKVEPVQNTDMVLMVSPDDFGFNAQTAESNAFQNKQENPSEITQTALKEFSAMVEQLQQAGVRVIVLPSRRDVRTPDAVFPNNWFSVHRSPDGSRTLVLYPMLAPNRRAERQRDLLKSRLQEQGLAIDRIVDLSSYESDGKFLEGTGSMVLDREHGVTFAVLSPRTNREVVDDFCRQLGYRPVTFHSRDTKGTAIYHTNVVMSVGSEFAVICLESIRDAQERNAVEQALKELGKKVIPISLEQVYHMCGNVMELEGKNGTKILLMSRTAYDHFTPEQKRTLAEFCTLLPVDIPTIENIGGGSARCMVGEIF